MPLSIWDYIRQRARDAVLAGIQDAMDTVEQGDTNGSQHAQANELASRLTPPKQLTGTTGPTATASGSGTTADPIAASSPSEAAQEPAGAAPSPAPGKSQPTPDGFDSELEKRLQEAADSAPPPATKATQFREPNGQPLRKRGRPRKDSRKDDDE